MPKRAKKKYKAGPKSKKQTRKKAGIGGIDPETGETQDSYEDDEPWSIDESNDQEVADTSDHEEEVEEKGEEDEGGYEVERIVDKRKYKGKVEYLIKWKGYSNEENTWEPIANLQCQELINEYNAKEKGEKSTSTKSKPKPASKVVASKETKRNSRNSNESNDINASQVNEYNSQVYVPEKIMGATELHGELLLLIKWRGTDNADLVPADIANVKCPQLVINFYQSKLSFRQSK